MKSRMLKADKFVYEIKDQLAGGWDTRRIGTLIKGIHDKINRALFRKSEHLLETLRHIFVASLTPAVVMCHIVAGEYVAKGIRTSGELYKER